MAQKTDLNINPYYDDFNRDKDFYKILFKPGYAIQARELTSLQSILQNQVESFGSNIFKEGSMVAPGGITVDNQFSAVKLNETNLGVDVSVYINNFIGKKVTGLVSGVTASIQYIAFTSDSDLVENLTIYVNYIDAGENGDIKEFVDGESLIASENVTYGNTIITSGTPFASLISENATSTGSAVSIDSGVYYVRGTFANVSKQTIILDYYTNNPSYRVGLRVDEEIVTSKDDPSLFDNAKGFSNYAAPGADRLKIGLTLVKKSLTDFNDKDFIELLRTDEGKIKKVVDKTAYNVIRDYIAKRTFDESGHYAVDNFIVDPVESLNDRVGNGGIYLEGETTEQGNIPSEDLMCIQVSPGEAYVAGYDVNVQSVTHVDVEKPRDTENVSSVNIPFEMGHLLRVNTVSGAPKENEIIDLKNKFQADSPTTIGKARVYTFNLTDASYEDDSTQWDLYLYDVQTYTNLTLNRSASSSEIPEGSFIKGKNSNASGFAAANASGTSLDLIQTSGTFINGEKLLVNGVEISLAIANTTVYGTSDIKSVDMDTSSFTGWAGNNFKANSVLTGRAFSNGISEVRVSSGSVTSPGRVFSGVKVGDIISVIDSGNLKYNQVTAVSSDLATLTIGAITSVSGVFDGTSITTGNYTAQIRSPQFRNSENAFLYANLPNQNIASVNLSDSQILITNQVTANISGSTITLNKASLSGIASLSNVSYESFDQERYSVHYNGGGIGTITSDTFNLTGGGTGIELLDLNSSGGNSVINVTLKKSGIQSKAKEYTRSSVNIVNLSRLSNSGTISSTSTNDGLTYNQYYGLRVQDEEISLNVPDAVKVLAVYESTNTADPILDRLSFSSIANVDTNAIIGEEVIGSTSGAVARVVLNSSTSPSVPSNNIGFIYLNEEVFTVGEDVIFQESNLTATVQTITIGKYKNITNNFTLDKGHKNEYCDYSRLVRVSSTIPERRLLVIYDHYTVPSNDSGDLFTVLSYDSERFTNDIPFIGAARASDTLDFRPRVSTFTGSSQSPFYFGSRSFPSEPKFILKPGESSLIGYDFYLPRIDKVFLDKKGSIIVEKGVSSLDPKEPESGDPELMQLATISLPAYLYDVNDASIKLSDNRRYTMRDIGFLEDRIENLERVTSLSLLELNTESLRVEDEDGNNRFKSGFFVDDFKDSSLSDRDLTSAQIAGGVLRPRALSNSLSLIPIPKTEVPETEFDLDNNYELLDSNVQKTGNAITLKYDSIEWISQNLATHVENVNPFNVIEYSGSIELTPQTDSWTRTVRLAPKVTTRTSTTGANINFTREFTDNSAVNRSSSGFTFSSTTQRRFRQTVTTTRRFVGNTTRTRDIVVSSGAEQYLRSRNVGFVARNLRPLERHYQFLDNHSNVNFVPKLVEIAKDSTLNNYGSVGTFQKGELVIAYNTTGRSTGTFRLAQSNHKFGPYNNPSKTYEFNPYVRTESIPSEYSQSSKTINIDIKSLSREAQGSYNGYVGQGFKLVGQTSGAVAYVKDLRLISDATGDLLGSFFIKNPFGSAPDPKILTGKKTYVLTSSITNEKQTPGASLISSADGVYTATGTRQVRQLQVDVTRNFTRVQNTQISSISNTNTSTSRTITRTRTRVVTRTIVRTRRGDPLAQSFSVGKDIDAPDLNGDNDDDKGAFLTKVGLFVAKKPSGNDPLTVQLRTMDLGIPTLDVLGSVTLSPDEITISSDGSIETIAQFNEPIYLAPGQEYAIVLLAKTTNDYEVWTARMGEATVGTQNLPNVESVIYSKQFGLGSLFKSQNGSIWTPAQNADMKFKLYRARFTTGVGIAHFGNNPIKKSELEPNPVVSLPKTLTLGITTTTNSSLTDILSSGRRIAGASGVSSSFGNIVSVGSSVNSVEITTGGTNYPASQSDVSTTTLIGSGTGLKFDITSTNGVITGLTTTSTGNGYAVGDVVSINNSDGSFTGRNAEITITQITGVDTLYLTNVQGESGSGKAFTGSVRYYDGDDSITTLGSVTIDDDRTSEGSGFNAGNLLEVNHFNHGMYATNNKLKLENIQSDSAPTTLSSQLLNTAGSSSVITVGDGTIFEKFEGLPVDSVNYGYLKIGDEIIKYQSVSSNEITITERGVDNTITQTHEVDSVVSKYEFSGVSLRRINRVTHNISDVSIDHERYYVEIDRGSTYGLDRSIDKFDSSNRPQLSFASEVSGGGFNAKASENLQFNSIIPQFEVFAPEKDTSISAVVRSTSGTSIDGSEISFQLLNKVDSVSLNELNRLSSTRIVCSRENELGQTAFSNVPGRRSFTSAITLRSNDQNLSPIIYLDGAEVLFVNNNLNNPVTNFVTDPNVKSFDFDPHSAVYVSNEVNLAQPASSLKVILTAYRPASSDIRVLYSLTREDSTEIEQSFELFPGYDNIKSSSGGSLLVVDKKLNSGLPDTRVRASEEGEFLEYEFSANNLNDFSGFRIKIIMAGTNQANVPAIRDLRAIALK
jgi:uncharacterized protein with FMN-binding domain